MNILKLTLPAVVAALIAGPAMAAPGSSWSVRGDNTVPGTVANNLTADGEGTDWTAAVLVVDLSAGSVYNDPALDSNDPQDTFWGFFPDLEFDTYVGIPGGINDVGPGLGPPVESLSGQFINKTWGGTGTETGPTLIANITLTDDSQGTWELLTGFAGGLVVESSGIVVNGEIVPEPTSLALMGLGGIAALRRRR